MKGVVTRKTDLAWGLSKYVKYKIQLKGRKEKIGLILSKDFKKFEVGDEIDVEIKRINFLKK